MPGGPATVSPQGIRNGSGIAADARAWLHPMPGEQPTQVRHKHGRSNHEAAA
jgi:hypothetical protein